MGHAEPSGKEGGTQCDENKEEGLQFNVEKGGVAWRESWIKEITMNIECNRCTKDQNGYKYKLQYVSGTFQPMII